jgi:ABC-2 type transport system ATP-binding protein
MVAAMTSMLRARGLAFREGRRWRVRDLDLDLCAGEAVGLLGTNGAGKSTTLALLAGTLAPSAGTVDIGGVDLYRSPRSVRRQLGLLPEHPPLHPDLTVDENLRFAARLRRIGRRDLAAACRRAVQRCDIGHLGRRLAHRLSRGEAQRVGLALAIVHEPSVLLLDEPTAGLDPLQASAFHELVRNLLPERAVLLSTHLLPDVEATCSRVVMLHQGRPVELADALSSGERRVRVELSVAATADELAALPGVLALERQDELAWTLSLSASAPPDLPERLAGRGWGLRAYAPLTPDLASRFAELVTRGRGA